MQAFEYANPITVKDAIALLSDDAAVLAGGTDLISMMKEYLATPKRLVNIKSIKELGGIAKAGGGLRIGATATFDDLATSTLVRTEYPSLQQAALGVTSPQIRNMGTVGGDLLQRPRCWYFRNGFGILGKDKDGTSLAPIGENRYHAIFPKGDAYYVNPSSLAPALIALGAKAKIAGPNGNREVAIDELYVIPGTNSGRELSLQPNEILTEIVVPAARGTKNATYEVRHKEALDWPLATASVALQMKGTSIAKASIVLGHVGPTPVMAAAAANALTGKTLNADLATEAGKLAVEGANPMSGNTYKLQLVRTAVKRALMQAGGIKA